jgi:hypothetical protein
VSSSSSPGRPSKNGGGADRPEQKQPGQGSRGSAAGVRTTGGKAASCNTVGGSATGARAIRGGARVAVEISVFRPCGRGGKSPRWDSNPLPKGKITGRFPWLNQSRELSTSATKISVFEFSEKLIFRLCKNLLL